MTRQDIGLLLLVFAPFPLCDSFGQRFDATYPHATAYLITATLLFCGLLLTKMKGNKK
jgi:hypothetical protein